MLSASCWDGKRIPGWWVSLSGVSREDLKDPPRVGAIVQGKGKCCKGEGLVYSYLCYSSRNNEEKACREHWKMT